MKKDGPEAKIQERVIRKLKLLDWLIVVMHGNIFQYGFPDLYCTHVKYGVRLVEIKNPLAYTFTPAQTVLFPKLSANGSGIWVLTSDCDSEIKKLFGPENWYFYLKGMF